MSDKTINVRLKASVSEYRDDMRAAAKETRSFGGEIVEAAASGNEALRGLSKSMVAVGGALLAGTAYGIKAFSDFDQKMVGSLAIMGDLTDYQRKDMSDAAREVAVTTRYSAGEAADAYFYLASAGLDATQSIAAMPLVAAFAQAGNFELARATDLLTDAQSALGLKSDDTTESMRNMVRVSDVLVKANTLANASVAQFSEALTNKAGAALRLLNKDMEEGVAVLAVFADQGVKGSEAGEKLNIVLRDLQTSSINNREEWDKLNISVFDSDGKMRNLADIVDDLSGVLGGASDEQARMTLMQLGFQDRSVAAIQTLLGLGGSIREYESALRDAGGTTDDVANKQIQNLNDQTGIMLSKWQDLAIDLGSVVAPALGFLVGNLGDVADALRALPDPLKKVVAVAMPLAGMALAVGGGFLLMLPRIVATRKAMNELATTAPRLAAAMRMMPMALGVLGAALALGTIALIAWNKKAAETKRVADAITPTLDSMTGALTAQTTEILRGELAAKDLVPTLNTFGVSVNELTVRFNDGRRGLDLFTEAEIAAARQAGVTDKEVVDLTRSLDVFGSGADQARQNTADLRAEWFNAARESGSLLTRTEALTRVQATLSGWVEKGADLWAEYQGEQGLTTEATLRQERAAIALWDNTRRLAIITGELRISERELTQQREDALSTVGRYRQATQRVAEAQAAYNKLVNAGITSGPEYEQAQWDLITALSAQDSAQKDVTASGYGVLEALYKIGRQAGLTEDELDILKASLPGLAEAFKLPQSVIDTLSGKTLPKFRGSVTTTERSMRGLAGVAWDTGRGISQGMLSPLDRLGDSWSRKVISEITAGIKRVRDQFGISSPSKLMALTVGLPLAEGIAEGIEGGELGVTVALRGVLDEASLSAQLAVPLDRPGGTPPAPSAAAPASPGGRPGVTIGPNTFVGADADRLARDLAWMVN